MTTNVTPFQLQFFRSIELDSSLREGAYIVLGEFDFFRIATFSSVRDYQFQTEGEHPSRPSSSVLVNWVPSSRSEPSINLWFEWIQKAPEAYLCRLDFGPLPNDSPVLTSIESIRELEEERPPSKATNWVNNQLAFIQETYRTLDTSEVICFQSIGAHSVYVLFSSKLDFLSTLNALKTFALNQPCSVAATTSMPLVLWGGGNSPSSKQRLWNAQLLITAPSSSEHCLRNTVGRLANEDPTLQLALHGTLGDFDFALGVQNASLQKLAGLSLTLHKLPGVYATTTVQWNTDDEKTSLDSSSDQELSPAVSRQVQLAGIDDLIGELSTADLPLHHRANFRRWRAELQWILCHLRLGLENPATQEHVLDIVCVLTKSIVPLFYQWVKKSHELEHVNFDNTFDLLTSAITQRKQPRLLPPADYPLASTTLSQGANLVLKAITRYIGSLFQHARIVLGDNRISTSAAVIFDYEDGFLAYPHHLFSIPFAAAFSPFSPEESWQTLSHEVSHAISSDCHLETRISVLCAISRLSNFITRDGTSTSRKEQIAKMLKSDFREVVAHWLDAHLFYFGDSEAYLRGIWATWKKRVDLNEFKQLEQAYLSRSFTIFCALHLRYREVIGNLDFVHNQEQQTWNEFYSEIAGQLSPLYDDFLSVMEKATSAISYKTIESYRSQTIIIASRQLLILSALDEHIPEFRNTSKPVVTATHKKNLISIKHGEIIEELIESPMRLIQELHQGSIKEIIPPSASAQLALILSLSNSQYAQLGEA